MFCTAYGHAPCAMAVRHDVAKAVGIVAGHGEALGFAKGRDEAPVGVAAFGATEALALAAYGLAPWVAAG